MSVYPVGLHKQGGTVANYTTNWQNIVEFNTCILTGCSRFNIWRRNAGDHKTHRQCDWCHQLPAPVWRHRVTWWRHVEHETDRYNNGDRVAWLVWMPASEQQLFDVWESFSVRQISPSVVGSVCLALCRSHACSAAEVATSAAAAPIMRARLLHSKRRRRAHRDAATLQLAGEVALMQSTKDL